MMNLQLASNVFKDRNATSNAVASRRHDMFSSSLSGSRPVELGVVGTVGDFMRVLGALRMGHACPGRLPCPIPIYDRQAAGPFREAVTASGFIARSYHAAIPGGPLQRPRPGGAIPVHARRKDPQVGGHVLTPIHFTALTTLPIARRITCPCTPTSPQYRDNGIIHELGRDGERDRLRCMADLQSVANRACPFDRHSLEAIFVATVRIDICADTYALNSNTRLALKESCCLTPLSPSIAWNRASARFRALISAVVATD